MSLKPLEYIASRIRVNSFLKTHRSKIQICPDLRKSDLKPQKVGLQPSDEEYRVEKPNGSKYDGIHFVGIGDKEQMIDLCIDGFKEDVSSVWVYLKLSDGNTYKIPCNDTRRMSHTNILDTFTSSGLKISCLSPMRRWRISYNGLLEKCNSTAGSELVHAKFSFIWSAMSRVHEQNISYSGKELTDAFIKENCYPKESDLLSLYNHQKKHEQWGQMMGTIKLEEQEKEFYFWSVRSRSSDIPLWNKDQTSAKFYMYLMDGLPLKIESLSVKNLVSNLTSGFTLTPNGCINPISRCNLDVDYLRESDRGTSFSFVTNGSEKRLYIRYTGGDETWYLGPNLQRKLKIRPFKVRMNDNEGFGVLHHSTNSNVEDGKTYRNLPPIMLKPRKYGAKRITEGATESDTVDEDWLDTFVGNRHYDHSFLHLDHPECRRTTVAGGKGASLSLLSELSAKTNEFAVPRGFIVASEAYDWFVNRTFKYLNAVEDLTAVAYGRWKGDLKAECDKCQELIATAKIPEYLEAEMLRMFSSAYDSVEDVIFAVRSSAYGEDSEELSAAGQMKTILGVKGYDNIYRAIMQCWASKFSFKAVQYARQNGQSLTAPVAVIVQEMVPSDFSGVLFTVDPVTGNPSYPCITANFGLGETVVSSSANPDVVTLKREKDGSLRVFETKIGSKMKQVFAKAEGGTEEKNYSTQSKELCLTKEWALKIGKAGLLVESCFGSPRDIEWAVHNNQLYLLQARPITSLHRETDFELRHDQDTPVRYMNDTWTTANVGEVFSGALSPLAISLVANCMDVYGHIDQIKREGQPRDFCPYYFHVIPVMQRHVALNLTDALLKANEKQITAVQRAVEIGMFGRSVITEEIHKAGIKKYGYASPKQNLRILLFILKHLWSIPKTLDKLDKEVQNYTLPEERLDTLSKVLNRIEDQTALFSKVRGLHGMITFLSSVCNMMLMTNLKDNSREWNAELYSHVATLLSDVGVESVDVPGSLQELARTIADNYGDKFSSLPADAAYDMLKNDFGPSGRMFDLFIERHGHRCAKELDVYSKPWRVDCESLIHTLQNMVRVPDILYDSPKNVSARQSHSRDDPALKYNQNMMVKLFLSGSRQYVSRREKSKSMLIKTIDWLRITCNEVGDFMVREGYLPDKNLVFFLTLEEISAIIQYQQPGLVHRAVRRAQLHEKLNELKFPEIIRGIPKPIEVEEKFSSDVPSFILTGTPVCQGTVKGRAVVALTLQEASNIKSGDILITYATDIGWSPYFPIVSGVVTVLGGLISHGAVVAREFGLPCVVAVENATTAFKTGDTVILNGTEGTVTKVLDEV